MERTFLKRYASETLSQRETARRLIAEAVVAGTPSYSRSGVPSYRAETGRGWA